MSRVLVITQADGSKYGVPVMEIAKNRAAHYAREFGGDIERSLAEDTLPLFKDDDYAIKDWAANNMNWSDVAPFHVRLKPADPPDFQEAWINGPKEIIDL